VKSNASFISSVILAIVFGAIASFLFTPRSEVKSELANAQLTPLPKVSRTPRPSNAPLVAGQSVVKVSSYNVQLIVTEPISDLVYGEVKVGTDKVAAFTTETLYAKYPACKPGALGTLLRFKSGTKRYGYQSLNKSIGGYDYYYQKPTFGCATDQAGLNAVAEAKAALINSALPTLN
jgi:hypothetical protein